MQASPSAVIRVIAGVGLVVVLMVILINAAKAIDDFPTASAIQVIQIYAENLFYAVLAIGVGMSVYIFTRGLEE